MFRECWDPDYAAYWKATYAHEVAMPRTKAGRGWVKKGSIVRNFNTKPGKEGESEFTKPAKVETENQAHLDAINEKGPGRLLIASKDEYEDPSLPDDQDIYLAWGQAEEERKPARQRAKEEW